MRAGAAFSQASSAPVCVRSRRDASSLRSARASARAATKSARKLPHRSARRSETTSCARTCTWTSGPPPSGRCGRQASTRSIAPNSAPPATATGSSRTGAITAAPAARGSSPTSPDEIRERYTRLREEAGEDVTVVVAAKYVSVDELGLLAEAGVEGVGENRAQDLAAKHARWGAAFRWHFIGHLQSRKAKTVNELCELCHSLSSESGSEEHT